MKVLLLLVVLLTGGMPQTSSAQFYNILKKAVTKRNKNEKKEDQGMTSATHKKNIGKILWASSLIEVGKEEEAAFKTKFKFNDLLYGRVYLPHSAENESLYFKNKERYCSDCYIHYSIYINGEKQDWKINDLQLIGDSKAWTTRRIYIRPKIEDGDTTPEWKKIVDGLPLGEHTVKIELHVYEGEFTNKEPIASGEFIFVKENEEEKLVIGKTFDFYQAKMKDEVVEKNILEAIQNHARANGWKESFVDVKIKDKNWTTKRNQYSGIIIGRVISAYCYAKWPDGHCTVQSFSFSQEHDGANYLDTTQHYSTGSQDKVNCSK